jgi:cobalt/nickel transport system permease protein
VHIPDGFLDTRTAATTAALSLCGVGYALRRVKRELPPRRVPLLGLAAAFLFVAQMINFPILGGTSGHLIGGVLVAALLGPSAAVVVITTVLIVQGLLFGDGGLTALGANVFNMALVDSVLGYAVYRVISGLLPGLRGRITAVAFAAWFATVMASIVCAGELAWSGMVAWPAAFSAMASVHMLIGIGEGLISALVFLGIVRTRPDLIAPARAADPPRKAGQLLAYGLLIVLGLAILVAPFACPWPDGLEHVARRLGFEQKTAPPVVTSPAQDYQWPGVHSAAGATAVAGVVGALIVFLLALVLGWLLAPRDGRRSAEPETSG